MAKIFKKSYNVRLPESQHEVEEFGKGKKGLVFCSECKAAYYKKSWHHGLLNLKSIKDNMKVNFVLCPACKMIKNKQYEGKVVLKFVPERVKKELLNLVRNYCERAYSRDPLDRLIAIKIEKKDIIVTVTENELANKLAQKIKDAFNKVNVKIHFNSEPSDTALAIVEFL